MSAPKRARIGTKGTSHAPPHQSVFDEPALPFNGDYIQQFEKIMAILYSHEKLQNIHSLPACDISAGGHSNAIFSQKDYTECLKKGNDYECVDNVFLHDVRWRPQKGLPFNVRGITDLKEKFYKDPPTGTTRCTIHIGGVDADTKIKEQTGRLRRISPEEPVHAFLWGVADYFSSDKLDDETTEKWIALIS